MKTLGLTKDGSFIVELTALKHHALAKLADVLSGTDVHYYGSSRSLSECKDIDLTNVVNLLREFVVSKDLMNRLNVSFAELERLVTPGSKTNDPDAIN